MTTGQPYNPYRKHEFAPVPIEALRSPVLSGNDKIVLAALIRRSGKNGRCYPSQYRLAEDCGLTRNQIRYALARLIDRHYIRVKHGAGTNAYEFLWHPTYVGESFHQRHCEDPPPMVNGSPQKDSIKDNSRPPRKPPQAECSDCNGTGWKDATRNGISAVTRCEHA